MPFHDEESWPHHLAVRILPFHGNYTSSNLVGVTILIHVDIKRRWKSLSFKIGHLRLEVEEREEILKSFERDFLKHIINIETEDLQGVEVKPLLSEPIPESRIVISQDENASCDQPVELPPAEVAAGPEEMKKLWKNIASIAHPDKTKNDPKKTALYKQAVAAWKSKSYDELCKIAIELGIEPPEASSEAITILNEISLQLEKKLKESETSILWLWGTTISERKQSIVDLYLRSRGKRRKPLA